jgi:hypothetical protein
VCRPPPLQVHILGVFIRRLEFVFGNHPDGALWTQGGPVGKFLVLWAIPEHVDLIVEICFHAVLQLDSLSLRVRRYREVEAPLMNNLVVIHVSFSMVEEVHLKREERQLQCIGNEGKCFGRVLLLKERGVFPTALGQGLLYMFRLRRSSQREVKWNRKGAVEPYRRVSASHF